MFTIRTNYIGTELIFEALGIGWVLGKCPGLSFLLPWYGLSIRNDFSLIRQEPESSQHSVSRCLAGWTAMGLPHDICSCNRGISGNLDTRVGMMTYRTNSIQEL